MKKAISKIISIGLSMCVLLTGLPSVPVYAENIVQENIAEENIAEEVYGWENGNQELDLSAIPEEKQKENSIGEYKPNEIELAETPLKEAADQNSQITKTTADSGSCGGENSEVTWEYADGTLTISGTGKMMDYPSGAPWYQYRYEITSLTVGKGVTYIGEAAFYGCSMLETVSLSNTIRGIGKGAFANCYYLKEIKLPNKITKINDYTFQSCAFTSVTLPASLKTLSALAFFRCGDLKSITISENNSKYKTQDGVLFTKDGKTLFLYPAGKAAEKYAVPSGVTKIGKCAFLASDITGITIPKSVKTIGESSFQESNLTSLTIPASVTKIGDFMCYNCKGLKNLVIKKGLAKLSYETFYGCSQLTSVSLGSVKDLDYLAFAYCSSLEEIKIPKGVTIIYNGSFGECTSLKRAVLSSTVKEIAYQAFFNCSSLTDIKLPKGLKVIHRYAFYGCSALKSVTLPSGIQQIGEHAFPDTTKLKNMPASLKKQEDGSYIQAAQVKIRVKESYTKSFQVLKKVNEERKKQGLGSLKMDKKLLETAMKRAAELSLYWGHTRPNGTDCFTACNLMEGENIAAGSTTAAGVMSLWMNSPGHKQNILTERWNTIGIGCIEINGTNYWVQCFGTKSSSTVKFGSYKNKSRNRTISVSVDKEYYRPTVQVSASKVRSGGKLKISTTWYNGFSTIKIPAGNLKYSSSDKSVCTVSKGTIKGIRQGTAKIKVWFPGYEKGAVTKKITVKGN